MRWSRTLVVMTALSMPGCARQAPAAAQRPPAAAGSSRPDARVAEEICLGKVDVLQRRLAAGLNANAEYAGCTLLQGAATCGRADSARVLIEHGANPSAMSAKGLTALHLATWNGAEAVVSLLLSYRVPVDETTRDGLTALHQASMAHQAGVAKVLLAHGAKVNASDAEGRTPLDYAVSAGQVDVVRELLEAGADPLHEGKNGHMVIEMAPSAEVFELLRDAAWAREPNREVELPALLASTILQQAEPAVLSCTRLGGAAPEARELNLVVNVAADGHVSSVEAGPTLGKSLPALGACVAHAMEALHFPQASVAASYPFLLPLAKPEQ